ncbi:hypothetical protein SFC88_18875 [Nocardioides sp. HM23]|uniref:hypothetical protein n=1 Tax=Nocardioides bizhenqiangii TaxID=3095076 RepID=UPI002ACAFA8A|nr:hypothetical protein [Nocardioides sp. HM23]MDZ5622911.1 hypothetical protein [Nocardioides sp. HM23]
MGQGQDPYGDAGGFTPYQPDATPDDEPADAAPEPFVPYGGAPQVPYSGAPQVPYGQSSGTSMVSFVTTTPTKHRWVGWVVGFGILLASCGGGIGGIFGALSGDGDTSYDTDQQQAPVEEEQMVVDVFANDLQAGQCLIGAGFDPSTDEGISNVEVVGCSTSHAAQVLEVKVLDEQEAAAYEFDDSSQIDLHCTQNFSRAQKQLFRGNTYFLLAFTQSRTPSTGDKVACLVVRADGGQIRGFLP